MVQALGIASILLLLAAGSFGFRLLYLRGKLKKVQAQLKEAKEAADEFRMMMETAGWKRLQKIAGIQVEGRENEILLQPTVNATEQEYKKGELQGIKLFMKLPELSIEMAKELSDRARELETDGDE